MLDLMKEIKRIIKEDPWLQEEINKGLYKSYSRHAPEWYEELDFVDNCIGEPDYSQPYSMYWRIYADCLREFGIMLFTQDLITGSPYTEDTRQTVKTLIEQYGLRNVTNEIAKQVKEIEQNV